MREYYLCLPCNCPEVLAADGRVLFHGTCPQYVLPELQAGPFVLTAVYGMEALARDIQFPTNFLELRGRCLLQFVLKFVVIDAKWEALGDGLFFDHLR